MDPGTVLDSLDAAMAARNRAAVAEAADALVGWLSKGGFMPVGCYSPDWRGKLTPGQLVSHLRAIRAVAEMP